MRAYVGSVLGNVLYVSSTHFHNPLPKRREVRWPATVLARPWRTAPHLTHTATPRHSWLVREAKRLREENCDLREHNAYLQEDNTAGSQYCKNPPPKFLIVAVARPWRLPHTPRPVPLQGWSQPTVRPSHAP